MHGPGSKDPYRREWKFLFFKYGCAGARFWFLCANASFDQAENLHAASKLAVLNFIGRGYFHSFCLTLLLLCITVRPNMFFGFSAHMHVLIKICMQP